MLIIGAVGLGLYLHAHNTEVAIESIAVLPFVNTSGDANTDYLSEGITESLINSFSQLPALRVIPRTTVFRYKGKETDAMAVGKELGVRAVLTGRITQRGDSLTLSVELVDVRDNKQLWGEQYNRKLADALAVQQEISREITDRQGLSQALFVLGQIHFGRGEYARAEPLLREGLDIARQLLGEDNVKTKEVRDGLADLYRAWGKPELAARLSQTLSTPTSSRRTR